MGAIFFLILLVIILIIAIIFILLSSILLIVRKSKGKTVSKASFVVPLILLIIGIVMALIPVLYLGSLRSNSAQQIAAEADEVIKVESADVLYWP